MWIYLISCNFFFFLFNLGKDGAKVTTVVATPGQGSDRVQEVSYTDTRVIGNGSFGVVFQAKLIETNELVAIKKVLQDRRFKVRIRSDLSIFQFQSAIWWVELLVEHTRLTFSMEAKSEGTPMQATNCAHERVIMEIGKLKSGQIINRFGIIKYSIMQQL